MSMSLLFARVSLNALKTIQEKPDLLKAIFFDIDPSQLAALGIKAEHCGEVDFLSLSAAYDGMAEHMGEDPPDDILVEDLDPTGNLDFEMGYGPGFYLDPDAVQTALANSMIPHMDDDAKEILQQAASHGEALVGLVS